MKLNLVKDIDDINKPGDAVVIDSVCNNSGKNIKQLILCCPQCGIISGSAGNHVYDEKTKSYSPSIVHNKDLGGCGWHGWLKNGEFKKC